MPNKIISSPLDISSQLVNMKFYVHFVKKKRMSEFLKHVGYFRCSRYGKYLISRTNLIGAKPSQDLLFQLYKFDSQLREILFHYCQIVEIQLKAYLADSISLKLNNVTFHLDSQYYTPSRSERDKIKKHSNSRFFNIFFQNLCNDSSSLMNNSKKYPELKEYRKGGTKATNNLPCWVYFSYVEFGTIVNLYAYLRGDLRSHVLKYGYSRSQYRKNTTKQFDTWLEAIRNLRNICAHHNILVGRTSSIILPETMDSHTLISNADLFSRIYALKKILPSTEHPNLKKDLTTLILRAKINVFSLGILPNDWNQRFDDIVNL